MHLRFSTLCAVILALVLFTVPTLAEEAGEAPAPGGGPEVTGQVQEPGTDMGAEATGQVQEPEMDMGAEAIEDLADAAGPDQSWPVFVEHRGDDSLGARLALRLKEIFNQSSLFAYTTEDQRKVKVLLVTREEFPGRARLGSIYAATFIYQASETMLAHHLATDLGFIAPGELDGLAEELAARTETVADRYAYLFE